MMLCDLLEEICTHSALAAIALQASYAFVCGFLTRIKVLAVCFAVVIVSVWPSCPMRGGVLVESGGRWARPFLGFVLGLRGRFVAHCVRIPWKKQQCPAVG